MDARSGEILQYGSSSEPRDFSVKETVVGAEKALLAVCAKDGVRLGAVNKWELRLVTENSVPIYQIKFYCNSVCYEAKVLAADGAVAEYVRLALTEIGSTPAEGEGTKAPAEGEGTKTPAEDGTKAPAEDGTKAPAEDGTKAPAEDGTKAPAEDGTKTPEER